VAFCNFRGFRLSVFNFKFYTDFRVFSFLKSSNFLNLKFQIVFNYFNYQNSEKTAHPAYPLLYNFNRLAYVSLSVMLYPACRKIKVNYRCTSHYKCCSSVTQPVTRYIWFINGHRRVEIAIKLQKSNNISKK
jgi:hypothetical protein